MKNSFINLFFFILVLNSQALSEELFIQAKNILLDKDKKISVFENEVIVKTEDGYVIKSNFAEYNRDKGIIVLRKKVVGTDEQKNTISTEFAQYDENTKILKSKGFTKIITSENYTIEGMDIILDNSKKQIYSERDTLVTDQDGNKIFVKNFDYQTGDNIFKSVGGVEVIDKLNNKFQFSQVYIDTKKKKY